MPEYLLGIDIGTSACKVALFTPDGEVAAQGSGDYPVYTPQPGWSEQAPPDWWNAVCKAIRGMLEQSGADPACIAGIGIDGQSGSAVPVGGDGSVLCNTPIWLDTRTAAICAELDEQLGNERLFAVSGNPLMPAYTLPKALWYKRERPELYKRMDKILQSNGYIAYMLTGELTQDISQGYGWQCFDMRSGEWNIPLCREMGLNPDHLPNIVPCHQIVGKVTEEAARATGLVPGIPVAAGGLDAACGSLGAGVRRHGEVQEQGGQAGGMSICLTRYVADTKLILSYHVVPDSWLLQGGSVGGGGIMRWMEQELGAAERQAAKEKGGSPMAVMDGEAAEIPPGSEGVIFLPYMSGERSPIWNPDAKGVFYGLDYRKTRAHLIRAGMEGAAFALHHNLEVAREAGAPVDEMRAMGGAANSRVWTQIKADVTGKRIVVPSSDTATTLGAAILAGVGVGVYRDFGEAVGRTVKLRRAHEPDMESHAVYQAGYRRYRQLYESLKHMMGKDDIQ